MAETEWDEGGLTDTLSDEACLAVQRVREFVEEHLPMARVEVLMGRVHKAVLTARAHERALGDPAGPSSQTMRQILLLAKLAHPEPQFFNPLDAFEAQGLRDRILAEASSPTSPRYKNIGRLPVAQADGADQ